MFRETGIVAERDTRPGHNGAGRIAHDARESADHFSRLVCAAAHAAALTSAEAGARGGRRGRRNHILFFQRRLVRLRRQLHRFRKRNHRPPRVKGL